MEALGTVLVVETDEKVRERIRHALPKSMLLVFAKDDRKAIEIVKERRDLEALLLVNGFPRSPDSFELLTRVVLRHASVFVLEAAEALRSEILSDRSAPSAPQPHETLAPNIVRVPSIDDLDTFLSRSRQLNSFYRRAAETFLVSSPTKPATEFTHSEREVLESVGFPVDGPLDAAPLANRAIHYNELLTKSLSTAQAAKRLKVNASRIRQRLTAKPPQLYGIRQGQQWRLPRFQFGSRGLIPGIDTVIERLPQMDPVAVDTWFSKPNVDLVHAGRNISPINWLAQGLPPETVADLAEDL
jgi:hypothetical protein